MKYFDLLHKPIGLVAICCLAIFVGCTENAIAPADDNTIGFSHSGMNRANADETELPDINATLWGYYKSSDNTATWVFGTPSPDNSQQSEGVNAYVKFSGGASLTPEGSTQYWTSNNYYFYSIWPNVSGSTVTTSGNVTIPNFEISSQLDLCLAKTEQSGAVSTSPVKLEYQHLLAKVLFKGLSNNETVRANLKSVKLTIPKLGTYTTENGWSKSEETYDLTSNVGWNLNYNNATDIIPNGWLVFPQTFSAKELEFTIEFVNNDGSITSSTGYIPVRENGWVAGYTYIYTFRVEAAGFIMFDEPTITTWGEASAGPTIVF